MGKDVQFAFRVESLLREQFILTCKKMDRPAGQVLREYMREYVGQNIQASLFESASDRKHETSIENRREGR